MHELLLGDLLLLLRNVLLLRNWLLLLGDLLLLLLRSRIWLALHLTGLDWPDWLSVGLRVWGCWCAGNLRLLRCAVCLLRMRQRV